MTEALKLVTSSIDKFCSEFCKVYCNNETSTALCSLCSPLCANVVLAMLSYGTSGTTQKQLLDALRITINENSFKTGYGNLIHCLNTVKGVELSVTNKLYVSNEFPLKQEYVNLTKAIFGSTLEQINLSNANEAAKKINGWCEEQTKKKIKEIISASDLGNDDAVLMLTTVYFKGQWQDKFDPLDTTEMPFYTDKNNFKNVPTMKKIREYNNGFIDELMASFIEIPYVSDELSMIIILPMEFGGLARLKENIDKINISEVLKTGFSSEVELHLPKFKIEATLQLRDTLKQMGVSEIFTKCADFSKMCDLPLYVDKAIQKAFIVVDEEGSEAAAATVITCKTRMLSLPKCFSINHPFIFQLVKIVRDENDVRIALPLFVGLVREPNFED